MKSSLVRRSAALALALVLVVGTAAFAVPISLEVETNLKVQTAAPADKLIPLQMNAPSHTLRLRAADSGKWTLHLDNTATGNWTWGKPRFRASLVTPPRTFDVWGNGYDLGGAKADPAELIVLGSLGTRPLVWGGMANAVTTDQMKIRTSFKLADANITTDVHALSSTRTNLEVYGDYKLDKATVGGVLRAGLDKDETKNATGLVGFVKTDLSGVAVGASAGARFGESIDGDNLAFGVNAETKLQDGQFVLAGEYVNRQKNFYEPDAQDAGFQNGADRFKNNTSSATQAASLLRVTGTWLGQANKGKAPLSVLHSTSEATLASLKGPAFQAIVQQAKDNSENPQTLVVARAGTRILPNNFWVVGQLKLAKDDDGVGTVGSVPGKDRRTTIDGRVRYNLADAGLANWFLLGKVGMDSTPGTANLQVGVGEDGETKIYEAVDKTGYSNTFGAELWYDLGKVRMITGIEAKKNTAISAYAADSPQKFIEQNNNTLYAQFIVRM